MNHRSRNTLAKIFQHPEATDLDWHRIETLFHALGAEVEHTSQNHLRVKLPHGPQASFAPPSHGHAAGRDSVIEIRHFLQTAGVSPEHAEYTDPGSPTAAAPGSQYILHLAHQESSIYVVEPGETNLVTVKPFDPWHHRHHLDHQHENTFAGQRAPEVPSYFDEIAAHLRGASEFLLIGHGTGKSDMRHLFLEYLKTHHRDLLPKLAGVMTIDEHLTQPQLVAAANEFFGYGR